MSNEELEARVSKLEEEFAVFREFINGFAEGSERRVENVEKLHANLGLAYTEMAASIEAVIAEVMSPQSEEDKKAFREDLMRRHTESLQMIQEVSREAAERNSEDTISAAVSDMAEQRQNSSSEDE